MNRLMKMTMTLKERAGRILTLSRTIMFLIIYYSVGVVGLSLPVTHDLFAALLPFSLLLSLALLFHFHHPWKPSHSILFIVIALLGYLAEVVGVQTGLIFGSYQYHQVLGVALLDTPLMIGLNWLMLIYCVFMMVRQNLRLPVLPAILTGASLMVVYDVVMEPVAVYIGMWSWRDNIIPWQNYLAWFLISAFLLALLFLFRIQARNKVAGWLFVIQFSFFLALNIIIRFQ